MNIRNRLIAGFLTLVMAVGMLPAFSIASNKTVEAATTDTPKVYVYESGKLEAKGMQKVVSDSKASFTMGLWHYSGGYWANGYNDPHKVMDYKFRKSQGGVANAEDAFLANGLTYGNKEFVYNIAKDSDLAKSLDAGEDVYVEIEKASQNPDVTLTKLFNFPISKDDKGNAVFSTNEDGSLKGYDDNGKITDSVAKVVKENGQWKIIFSLPIKMNVYDEKEFSFDKFNLRLNKYIPIPKLGYGWIMFSMFPRTKDGIQNNGNLPAYLWFADENGSDYSNWQNTLSQVPDNKIHPLMINPTGTPAGHSGYLKDGFKIKLLRDGGKIVDSGDYKIGIDTFSNAGAVGMYFDYSLKLNIYAKPKTKVIASYVEVVDVKSDGTPVYKTIAESEKLTDVQISNGYAYIDSSRIIDLPNGEKWVGLLNDVISSPKDLGEAEKVDWSANLTPDSPKGTIEATALDIDYYKFAILTNDKTQSAYIKSALTTISDISDERVNSARSILYANGVYNYRDFEALSVSKKVTLMTMVMRTTGSFSYSSLEKTITPYVKSTTTKVAEELRNPLVVPVNSKVYEDSITIGNKAAGSDIENMYGQTSSEGSIAGEIGSSEEVGTNIVYIKYVCFPQTIQRNRIHIIEDGKEVGIVAQDNIVGIQNDTGLMADIEFHDLTPELQEISEDAVVTLNKWISSSEEVNDLITNPIPSTGSKSGTTIPTIIPKVPKTEDIYVDWTVELKKPGETPAVADVPQWRLSKYIPEFDEWKTAMMWLSLSGDRGHATSFITPSGSYNYDPVNPNEKVADSSNTPENQKLYSWVHSKALTKGSYFISHGSPLVAVQMNGTRTYIKSTEDSGLTSAKWIEGAGTQAGLLKYDVKNGFTPNTYSGGETYFHSEVFDYGLKNKDVYIHYKGVYYHYDCGGEHCSGHCGCYTTPEVAGPNYLDAEYDTKVTFDRYKQANTDSKKLAISPEVNAENGLTTIKYQLSDTLNIYPEYGMLFANDNGDESIKWIVGDQARKVSPVVWQTLQHKVYVVPVSNGTSYATDSRAITQAKALGESSKQVIYKGAGVNTAFKLARDASNLNSKAILTVKTFALDFRSDGAFANVKSAWGDGSYNSYTQHQALLNSISTKKTATASEKLLVDSPSFGNIDYTGAIKNLTTGTYNLMKYNGKDYVEFEHKLIVRGGALIGVVMNNRNGGTELLTPEQLKMKDITLYNAIVGMNLYNEDGDRSKTIFSTFEHQTGIKLTEAKYATMLASARQNVDKIVTPASSAVKENEGWYSEDTTVLVIKEYVSNYEVPSISFGDKLSMSVKGLDTPIDKAQFFKAMGKGYTYLRYDLDLKPVYSSLKNDISCFFEYTSFPNDVIVGKYNKDYFTDLNFGQQAVDYLVPNVSVSDTTRLS